MHDASAHQLPQHYQPQRSQCDRIVTLIITSYYNHDTLATCSNFHLTDYANYPDNLGSDNGTVCVEKSVVCLHYFFWYSFGNLLPQDMATLDSGAAKISLIRPPLVGRKFGIDLTDRYGFDYFYPFPNFPTPPGQPMSAARATETGIQPMKMSVN